MRTITSFPIHSNYNQEIVDAEHINAIQSTLNEAEARVNHISNQEFLSRLLFIFQNTSYAHLLSYHDADHQFLADLIRCQRVDVDETVQLTEKSKDGYFETQLIQPSTTTSTIDCVSAVVDAYLPVGSSIQCFVKVNNELIPVDMNGKTQTALPNAAEFRGVIKLRANTLGESPVIYGFGYLFSDSEVKESFTIGYK